MQSIPRSTKREAWEELWRWKRLQEQELAKMEKQKMKLLKQNNLPAHIRNALIDELINPPLLMGTPL